MRDDHFAKNLQNEKMEIPQVISDNVRAELSAQGNFEPANGGRLLSVNKLIEIAQTPDGLLSVLRMLQHEAANVAMEVQIVASSYQPSQNEAIRFQINNYNAMLTAINSFLDGIVDKKYSTTVDVQKYARDILRSMDFLRRSIDTLTTKVRESDPKRA